MAKNTRIHIRVNRFPEIARRFSEATELIVRKAAYDVEGYAKAVVPVKIGKLKNSISTEFPSRTKAIIAPHTNYAEHVEFGTRFMRERPYMRPAAEKVRPSFLEAFSQLERLL